jgi:hypothetical protein
MMVEKGTHVLPGPDHSAADLVLRHGVHISSEIALEPKTQSVLPLSPVVFVAFPSLEPLPA